MAKSRQDLRARVSQAAGRRRKKPTNRVESAFNDVAKLVRGVGTRLFDGSGKDVDGTKPIASEQARNGRRRPRKRRTSAEPRRRSLAVHSRVSGEREDALLVVELALERAESAVGDAAAVAPAHQLLALGVEQRSS